jgi:hypothetical protein
MPNTVQAVAEGLPTFKDKTAMFRELDKAVYQAAMFAQAAQTLTSHMLANDEGKGQVFTLSSAQAETLTFLANQTETAAAHCLNLADAIAEREQ